MSEHKTTGGISFARDPIWIPVKLFVGDEANAYVKQHGHKKKWLGDANYRSLAHLATDKFPYLEKEFEKHSTHVKKSLGYTLAHRARFCWPPEWGGKNELVPLLKDQFKSTITLVRGPSVVHLDDIWSAQEEQLYMKVENLFGVYIQEDLEVPERGYIGGFNNLRALNGHKNSPYRFIRFLATLTKSEAVNLEGALHAAIELHRGVTKIKGAQTKGQYRCADGFLNTVNEVCKPFMAFYNTIGWR